MKDNKKLKNYKKNMANKLKNVVNQKINYYRINMKLFKKKISKLLK